MTYVRRILDDVLDDVAADLPAIAIEGAKGVGKTATAQRRARTILRLDDQDQNEAVRADAGLISRLPDPVLIDEWQLVPSIWDSVRRAVDDTPDKRFLLTGSAGVPAGTRLHSGAGRIVRLVMRPFSLHERGVSNATVSLRSLMDGTPGEITGQSAFTVPDYVDEILRSGFPAIRRLPPRARNLQLDSYLDRIVERELPDSGTVVRRPTVLRSWLAAYGAATATDASYTAILDAATAGEAEKPARQTVTGYRDQLHRLFVLDPLPAWTPTFTPLKRLTSTPKHHLVDPALAARMSGATTLGLLRGDGTRTGGAAGTWLGALFESLVTQSVRIYADAIGATVGHVRTRSTEHEIDLIVEAPDGGVVAIEVKLAPAASDHDVRHLNWLRDLVGDRLRDRVVINTGQFAYRRRDGVAVVPFALLGP